MPASRRFYLSTMHNAMSDQSGSLGSIDLCEQGVTPPSPRAKEVDDDQCARYSTVSFISGILGLCIYGLVMQS